VDRGALEVLAVVDAGAELKVLGLVDAGELGPLCRRRSLLAKNSAARWGRCAALGCAAPQRRGHRLSALAAVCQAPGRACVRERAPSTSGTPRTGRRGAAAARTAAERSVQRAIRPLAKSVQIVGGLGLRTAANTNRNAAPIASSRGTRAAA
jgi:hypothetical protein